MLSSKTPSLADLGFSVISIKQSVTRIKHFDVDDTQATNTSQYGDIGMLERTEAYLSSVFLMAEPSKIIFLI